MATTAPMDDSDATLQLVSELESVLAITKDGGVAPTTLQFYKLGLILYALDRYASTATIANVRQAYHELLDSLPLSHQTTVFRELQQAIQLLIQESQPNVFSRDMQSALESLAGLFRSSPLAAECTTQSKVLETTAALASIYGAAPRERQPLILSLLSQFMWAPTMDWERLLAATDRIQQEPNVWKDLVEWEAERDSDWIIKITSRYPDETQQDYLSSVLSSTTLNYESSDTTARTNGDSILPKERQTSGSAPAAATKPEDEIQRRIDQVRQMLPDLGEGFVETALSYYKGSLEQTMQALLDDQSRWPAPLQIMDRTLPRRHRNVTNAKKEEEARLAAKATLRAAERQQREEAAAVEAVMRSEPTADEYNDDYDDQYDDTEGFGGADSGLYDDFEAVRTYNRVLKGVEEDQSFWQESRNTNRSNGDTRKNNSGSEKEYRGPDKGRGGRIPNAGRGRGAGRGGAAPDQNEESAEDDADIANVKDGGKAKDDGKTAAKPNPRQKARKMAKRRDQQKKAAVKRTG
jgi:hypothetical protein